MKKLLIVLILTASCSLAVNAQQQPTQPAQPANPSAPQPNRPDMDTVPQNRTRQTGLKERQRREQQINDRRPTQEQPRRLRPDSLRRGGATNVDTLRR